MKMVVIKTSIKRKILRTVVPMLVSAGGIAAFALCVPAAVGLSTFLELPFPEHSMSEIENMNSLEPVLYEAVHETPVQTPVVTEEAEPEQAEQEQPEIVQEEQPAPSAELTYPTAYLCTQNMSDANDDLSRFTSHSGEIYEETFGHAGGPEYIELSGGGQLRNCTEIDNKVILQECSEGSQPSVTLYSEEPQVLILHTHTTESYEPYIKDWYDEQYMSRSSDPDNSVVAVGAAIAEQLANAGISVIHDCTIHDDVYTGAYDRSLATTLGIMERYPTIKAVLDIHRDAIEYRDGTRISAVTEIDGKKAAQVMVICAADDGTYGVPDFIENLHFASGLQSKMESMYPTLTRPILFQYCQYNQQVSPGALLIEVGSHGNSIDEAVYSGELIGKSLASLLTENAEPIEAVPVLANVPMYFLDRLR